MLQILAAAATFLGGAFFGSQVDDKVEVVSHPYGNTASGVSGGKMLTYGLMALGALVVYQKFIKKVL